MNAEHPLAQTLEVLTREWFQNQIRDLPPDELPPVEEMESDIADMRDETLQRVARAFDNTDCTRDGRPNDRANAAAIERLAAAFVGLERTTPIFAKLPYRK
jgi:hypothetical protein